LGPFVLQGYAAAQMKKHLLATVAVFSVATSHAPAQDLKSKFLNNFANAVVVAAACKAWKVNREMAVPAMRSLKITTDDISPGGADWPLFQQDIQEAQKNVNDLDHSKVCMLAALMFGPNGVVAPT
jgi:hypothetical protein